MKDRKFTITISGSFVVFIVALIYTWYNDVWEGVQIYLVLYLLFALTAILEKLFECRTHVPEIKKLKGKEHE
jgi:hypothetical protein